MDNLIAVVLQLLILSQITERITNFIKLNTDKIKLKKDNIVDENERKKLIEIRSIIVGILVALICKANIFEMFSDKFAFFWNGKNSISFSNVIGSIICGPFLSVGSQFFHDLLDLLLQVKNLKRKLNDRADFDFNDISEVDEFLKDNEQKRLKELIETEFEKMQGDKHYFSTDLDKQEVTIHTFGDVQNLPSAIPFKSSTGKLKLIKIRIQKHSTQIRTLATLKPGDEIANEKDFNDNAGSFGFPVIDINSGKRLLLTCYHAVWNEKHNWGFLDLSLGNLNVVHPVNNTNIKGVIKHAIKNAFFDIALIEPNSGVSFSNEIKFLGVPKSVVPVDISMKGSTVTMLSRSDKSKARRGRIIDVGVKVDNIKYPGNNKFALENLICIQPFQKPFSVRGDSGSIVLDDFGNALGILVAGDEENVSFAIPLQNIFNFYNLKI